MSETNPFFDDAALMVVPFRDTELDAQLEPLEVTASPRRSAQLLEAARADALDEVERIDSMTHWEAARDMLWRMAKFVAGALIVGLVVVAYVRQLP